MTSKKNYTSQSPLFFLLTIRQSMALAKKTMQVWRIPSGKGIFGKDTAAVVRNPSYICS
jgi:hypothetical protein